VKSKPERVSPREGENPVEGKFQRLCRQVPPAVIRYGGYEITYGSLSRHSAGRAENPADDMRQQILFTRPEGFIDGFDDMVNCSPDPNKSIALRNIRTLRRCWLHRSVSFSGCPEQSALPVLTPQTQRWHP
jgi:hypothetical protein